MSYSGPVEDRLAIRELVETYNDAVFRRDAEAWGGTWADDAIWDFMGHSLSGKETIVGTWIQAMKTFDYVAFNALPGAINVNGNEATARVYVQEVLKTKDAPLNRVEGLYEDTLRKEDDVWRFTRRTYQILRQDAETQ